MRDLGTLDAETPSVSGSGIIAVDADCTSSQRNPDATGVYYTRRHTFTLDAAATVSVSVDDESPDNFVPYAVLIEGSSSDGSGTVVARAAGNSRTSVFNPERPARLSYRLLEAGTYTVEATTLNSGRLGAYSVSVRWAAVSRDVTVSAASAGEGDGVAVFTLSAAVPDGVVGPAIDVAPITVRWATLSGTAAPGADYQGMSGWVSIPADGSRATVLVPLVDNAAVESVETFSLRLTDPGGATLIDTSATATIIDDDSGSTALSPISACDDVVLRGSVGDVFDIAQSGYSADHHVFVDVDVSCGGTLESGVGFPIGVEVTEGPASSLGGSEHCLVSVGGNTVTSAVSAGEGCVTFASPAAADFTQDGRSTHLVRIPDDNIGEDHQLLIWLDTDRDNTYDPREPKAFVVTDFVNRARRGDGSFTYGLPEDFEVQVVPGSDRVSRGGQWTELRLRAVTGPTTAVGPGGANGDSGLPISDAPMGAFVAVGPSAGTEVVCLPVSGGAHLLGAQNDCRTDDNGEFVVRYETSRGGVHLLREAQDTIRVWLDRDRDGTFAGAPNHPGRERSRDVHVQIAKAVNYVALGDSYAAGEQGKRPDEGTYQSGVNGADGDCRRWDRAYPFIIRREFFGAELGIDVEFHTFACTGALALNIYDASDPEGLSSLERHVETNRPSPAAAKWARVPARPGAPLEWNIPVDWEPRQSVSLAGIHDAAGVDMVTLTVGGNDAGFGDGVVVCAIVSECDPAPSDARLAEVEDQIVGVLARVRQEAPDAVVFVLGYPYLTPEVDPCANPEVIHRPGRPPSTELSFDGLPDGCEALWDMYRAGVDECDSLSATGVVRGSLFYVGGTVLQFLAGSDRTRIDYREAKALWAAADSLNEAVRSAAERSGAHFVDVVGGVPLPDSPRGFVGHSSCNTADPWLHGYAPKSGLFRNKSGADGRTFHPTEAGQRAYARILEEYIRRQIDAGAELSDAGLPLAPAQQSEQGGVARAQHSVAGSAEPEASETQQPGDLTDSNGSAGGKGLDSGESAESADSVGLLLPRAMTLVSGCGEPFVSPGEQVTLTAGGFAPNAMVSIGGRSASLGSTELAVRQVAAAIADADGVVTEVWTVPPARAKSRDVSPRAYWIEVRWPNGVGGTHTSRLGLPLVAYPRTAPCALADTAATTLGVQIQIEVLSNDIAPTRGSLAAGSVEVREAQGGSFRVDAASGVVIFTPNAGFWGLVHTTYVVYDEWGIGVEADLTVTVSSGCTITGTPGVTLIEGTDGDDVICVPDRGDYEAFHIVDAKGGDDVVLGGAGVEWVYGGAGSDTIYSEGGDDRIFAGPGVDKVRSGPGMDSVYSDDLADTVVDDDYELVVSPRVTVAQSGPEPNGDWAWADVSETVLLDVLGNDHDDNEDVDPSTLKVIVEPTTGQASVEQTSEGVTVVEYTAGGVGGSDSFTYEICDSLGVCAIAEVTVMVGNADCTMVGTDGDDVLRGTSGADVICGLGGSDKIYGLGGNDVLVGGPGNDTLYGGNETLADPDDGDDLLWGGPGDDIIYGGDGSDAIWGGPGDDSLYGNRRGDRIHAGAGNDTVAGGGGNDRVWGGPGDDDVEGRSGDDTLWGGPGVDMLSGGNGDDTVWGNTDADTLTGGKGADRLHGGGGDDIMNGGDGSDAMWGGPGDDTLKGKGHQDELHGGAGADTLWGGSGDDRVWGGVGDDVLDGGVGVDFVDGGAGGDRCVGGRFVAGCELPVGVW